MTSEGARKQWARRSPEERAAVGAKISAAKKGKPRDPDAVARTKETLKARWATATPEERAAKIAKARTMAQTPTAKRKRAEACRRWRDRNPGLPGSFGLTLRETVALFFASRPGATDAECAEAIGRTVYMVRRHRDKASRVPWKRDLLRKVLARHEREEILRFFRGNLPKCPICGERAASVWFDQARFGGRWCGRCACGRSFVTPPGSRVRPKPLRAALSEPQLLRFFDAVASGWTLRRAHEESGINNATADKLVTMVLIEFGGLSPSDWRPTNYRKPAAHAEDVTHAD